MKNLIYLNPNAFQENQPSSIESSSSPQTHVATIISDPAPPPPPIKHKFNGPINAISISPERDHAVVAGREVLKVLEVTEESIKEVINLRAGSRANMNFSCNDVKWGIAPLCKHIIASATTNGSIILWDLNKITQKFEHCINDHTRTVNRICFHPTDSLLLSASQDGTMKIWDIRVKGAARHTYNGKAENVRDVAFNPSFYYEFVAGFENGIIQKWDIRNPSNYERKLNAHGGIVLSLDWHSNSRYLASGGRDKIIKVWDMKSESRKPLHSIQTIASLSRLQWRPGYVNQLASCSLLTDNRIHVWDLNRPYVPFSSMDVHDNVTTGFLWQDSDTIWSCSKDKHFVKHNIKGGYHMADQLSTSGLAWNIFADLAYATSERKGKAIPENTMKLPTVSSLFNRKRNPFGEKVFESNRLKQYLEIPVQHTGTMDSHSFDFDSFVFMAVHYSIDSIDINSSCENNALVAYTSRHYRTAQTWKIIQLLYFQDPVEQIGSEVPKEVPPPSTQTNPEVKPVDIHPSSLDAFSSTPPTRSKELRTDLLGSSPAFSDDTGKSFSSVGVAGSFHASEVSCLSEEEKPRENRDWVQGLNLSSVMEELLNYYASQGDVQMCVTLLLVIRNRIKIKFNLEAQWFSSYIDLLRRFKLWTVAASIILASSVPVIRSRNQESTTIYTSCNHCFKPILNTSQQYWYCEKCRQLLNPCSICHRRVKGLYSWCQGCGHGGHRIHLEEWFADHSECPTGCGHLCDIHPSDDNSFM